MILVSIVAEVVFLADLTIPLERSFVSSGIRTGLCRKDFLVEDFGRDRWKGGNTTFQVVSTARLSATFSEELKKPEHLSTYCQSLLMCVRCASLFLNATAHELQVYGCVWERSRESSIVGRPTERYLDNGRVSGKNERTKESKKEL